eukprot:SAG22_NODE_9152_length_607_cov_0.988189_1_plen_20_part_10
MIMLAGVDDALAAALAAFDA